MGAVKQYESTAHVSVPSFGLSTRPGMRVNAVPGSALDRLLERRVGKGFKKPELKLVGSEAAEHEEASRNFEREMKEARAGMAQQVEKISAQKASSDARVEEAITHLDELRGEIATLQEQQVGLARENVALRKEAALSEERAAALRQAEEEVTALRKKIGDLEAKARRARKKTTTRRKAPPRKKAATAAKKGHQETQT